MNVHDFLDYRMEKTAALSRGKAFAQGFGRGAISGGKKGAMIGTIGGGSIGALDGAAYGVITNKTPRSTAGTAATGGAAGAIRGGAFGGLTGGVIGGVVQGIKEMRKAGQKPTVAKVKSIAERITGKKISKKHLQTAGLVTATGGLTMAGMYGINKKRRR